MKNIFKRLFCSHIFKEEKKGIHGNKKRNPWERGFHASILEL